MAIAGQGVSAYLDKARRALDEGGVPQLTFRVARRLCSPLLEFGSITFFKRELGDRSCQPNAGPGFQLRQAFSEDLPLVAELDHGSPRTLRDRFDRGDLCFVALDADGKPVHARWATVAGSSIPEIDGYLALPPGAAYFYDGYTRPAARRRGLDAAMREFIFDTMRARGCRTIYSYAREDNPPALRAARRRQQSMGAIRYLRFRGCRPILVGSRNAELPPGLHVRERERDDTALRARRLRQWFESWLEAPLAKRSTGYDALPEEYFESTAQFIVNTIDLDAATDLVLDVGCDSAMVSRLVAPHCWRFTGVDLIPGMLADVPDKALRSASGRPACFAAADGTSLPFRSGTFTKVYCSGVVHTLPSRDDGAKLIQEMVRVCRPGGTVLVAAIPDTAKRFRRYRDVWRRAGAAGKTRLLASLVMPRPAKDGLRRLLGLSRERLVFLDYDVRGLRRDFEARRVDGQVLDFPKSYWSADFRDTRSNLRLRVSGGDAGRRRD